MSRRILLVDVELSNTTVLVITDSVEVSVGVDVSSEIVHFTVIVLATVVV